MRAVVGHFEIPVDDLERAAGFYRAAFGWRVERLAWDGPVYATVRMPDVETTAGAKVSHGGGGIGGGLMDRRGLRAEGPLLVVHVEDGGFEECLERITAAGGRVEQPPRAVGELGTFARIRDTEGNPLGVWQGKD